MFQNKNKNQNKPRPTAEKSLTKEHRPLFMMILVAVFLCSANALQLTQAQGGATADKSFPYPFQDTSTDIDYQCEPDMKVFAANQSEDFRNFLENNFQNKSSTSSLLEPAIGKYREMRQELMTAYSKYYPNQGAFQLTAVLQPSACLQIVNDTLNDAKILLEKHALRTSGVKKTTAMLEKYQAINGQLQNLAKQFTSMKAYFDAFSQKIPCYVPKGSCVKG